MRSLWSEGNGLLAWDKEWMDLEKYWRRGSMRKDGFHIVLIWLVQSLFPLLTSGLCPQAAPTRMHSTASRPPPHSLCLFLELPFLTSNFHPTLPRPFLTYSFPIAPINMWHTHFTYLLLTTDHHPWTVNSVGQKCLFLTAVSTGT